MPESVRRRRERGVDIDGHVARRLAPGMAEPPTSSCAWRREHRERARAIAPESRERTFTLKELVRLLESLPAVQPRRCPRPRERVSMPRHVPGRPGSAAIRSTTTSPTRSGCRCESYRAIAWELDEWIERLVDGLFGPVAAPVARARA